MIIKNLKKRMDKHKISNEALAYHAGVTTQTVINAKNGKSVSNNTGVRIEKAMADLCSI